jgi:hypothetical protein
MDFLSRALLSRCSGRLPLSMQEKKLERMRIGGDSATATQMPLWFAKEVRYYEKNGLSVESVSIPESSLALQAMLSGELPIVQAGGAAPIQASVGDRHGHHRNRCEEFHLPDLWPREHQSHGRSQGQNLLHSPLRHTNRSSRAYRPAPLRPSTPRAM